MQYLEEVSAPTGSAPETSPAAVSTSQESPPPAESSSKKIECYKVVQATQMTNGLNSDEVLRELKEGDVFEKLEVPKKDATSALRVRGRVKDERMVGWATIAAKGTVHLELIRRD